jgi:hypothetical protein
MYIYPYLYSSHNYCVSYCLQYIYSFVYLRIINGIAHLIIFRINMEYRLACFHLIYSVLCIFNCYIYILLACNVSCLLHLCLHFHCFQLAITIALFTVFFVVMMMMFNSNSLSVEPVGSYLLNILGRNHCCSCCSYFVVHVLIIHVMNALTHNVSTHDVLILYDFVIIVLKCSNISICILTYIYIYI